MRLLKEKFATLKAWAIRNQKKIGFVFILLLILIYVTDFSALHKPYIEKSPEVIPTVNPTNAPFGIYQKPKLTKSDRYDVYLIGDSMTDALGPRGGIFTELLSKEYPNVLFEVSNYSESESILALPEHIAQSHQAAPDLLLKPVTKGNPDPDLIIIESYGYNPPSQFGVDGPKKQEEILTTVMTTLTNRYPATVIMFLATIAPDKKTFGKNINKSTAEERWVQGEERIRYIDNHLRYAKAHEIPFINVYEASLDEEGDGDTKYINPDDNIHPSAEGLALMARIMTARIVEENIFPK